MSRQKEIEDAARAIAKKTWGLQPPSAIEALTEMAKWADSHQPYAEVNKVFAKQITEENLQLRATLAVYQEALEIIAELERSAQERAIKNGCDIFLKSYAIEALEKGRTK